MTNTTPQPIPSVEEVVAAFEELVPEVGFEWCQGHQHDVERLIRTTLTARDAYWAQHEQEMYESLDAEYQRQLVARDAAHQEAMGEMVREILELTEYGHVNENDIKAIARSRGVGDAKSE